MKKSFNTLQLSYPEPYILQINLNRPEYLNAINSEMMREFNELWQGLYIPSKEIRCIILTGHGAKAFCAGADLKERNKIDITIWKQQHAVLQQAMLAMLDCPIPIIAAVNGVAFGGGLELVLAADFAYAAATATFAQPETKWGIMPGAMGTQNLARACGLRRARELSYTARAFSAEEALEWGVVNALYQPNELLPAVLKVAQQIVANAPFAVRQTKKSIKMSQALDPKAGYFYEIEAYNQLLNTKDREEGIRAFNEKRRAIFYDE